MDAADYHRIANQLGVCDTERDHVLASAHWDLTHRPEQVHGDDPYEYAARLLTAFRALPVRHQAEVHFPYPAWTPGGIVRSGWPPRVDEHLKWWMRRRAELEAAGKY